MVTGGAGFIGSTLVDRLLAEGHAVDVIDDLSTGSLTNLADARSEPSNDLTFQHLDIRSPKLVELMARRRPEVVFHLAAQADVRLSVSDPALDAEINILGSLRVLEGARRAGTSKVVFAASGGTLYGDVVPSELPVRESHPQAPMSPYGVSKKVVVDYLTVYRELHNIEFCALALGNVYGPRQDPHGEAGVVAIFAGHLVAGEQCTIFGDGSQTRDFVFVDDVVDALARAGQRGGGLLINIGTGAETSVIQLYETMADEAGTTQRPVFAPARAGELHRSCLDPGRASIHLGWKPWTTLAEGTAAVLASAPVKERRASGDATGKAPTAQPQRKRSSR
jgi:UDP-glucose 4-epimerase